MPVFVKAKQFVRGNKHGFAIYAYTDYMHNRYIGEFKK